MKKQAMFARLKAGKGHKDESNREVKKDCKREVERNEERYAWEQYLEYIRRENEIQGDKRVTVTMRQRGRKRRIVQHSKSSQLSFVPLSALPCCVTSKRGGAQGGMNSSHESVRWGRQRNYSTQRNGGWWWDDWNSREAWKIEVSERTKREVREMIKSRHAGLPIKDSHKVKERNTWHSNDRRCTGGEKYFYSSFPLHPSLPSSLLRLRAPPSSPSSDTICWNHTARMKWLHWIKLAAAAKALSHADSAVL